MHMVSRLHVDRPLLESVMPPARPLETARLVLRPLRLEHAEQTQLPFPKWEIVRYLAKGTPWPYPADRPAFDSIPDSWNKQMPDLVIAHILFG